MLSGQLDNVLTAAMLVHLFSIGFQGTAFFTAEEECGGSWRYLLEWYRRFGKSRNELLVLDTSPYRNREEADKQLVTLRNCDEHAEFNLETTQNLVRLCQEMDIEFSFKDQYIEQINAQRMGTGIGNKMPLGRTELGRICANANGLVHGTTLQIPTTGYHTMNETATIASCQAFLSLLKQISMD